MRPTDGRRVPSALARGFIPRALAVPARSPKQSCHAACRCRGVSSSDVSRALRHCKGCAGGRGAGPLRGSPSHQLLLLRRDLAGGGCFYLEKSCCSPCMFAEVSKSGSCWSATCHGLFLKKKKKKKRKKETQTFPDVCC